MLRILLVIALLGSSPSSAYDGGLSLRLPSKQVLIHLLILSSLASYALADTNSTAATNTTQVATDNTTILATTYFAYWSIWVGNAFGITDCLSWTTDWIFCAYFYFIGDSRKVKNLKRRVQELKEIKQSAQQAKILSIAKICGCIGKYIAEEKDPDRSNEVVLKCIALAKDILKEEIAAEEAREDQSESDDSEEDGGNDDGGEGSDMGEDSSGGDEMISVV